jgi:hypothetical protein
MNEERKRLFLIQGGSPSASSRPPPRDSPVLSPIGADSRSRIAAPGASIRSVASPPPIRHAPNWALEIRHLPGRA